MSTGQHRPAAPLERIVLTGFMGAGKSTVGRILAARLGWRFFDTDSLVTAKHQLSVAEIFRQHGEAGFRRFEADAVRDALRESACILALGGGAIETDAVRQLLFSEAQIAPGTWTVYLEAPLNELLARCARHADRHVRPLLADDPQARLLRRLPHYQRAHITVPTQHKSPEAVVDLLLQRISQLQAPAGAQPGSSKPFLESKPGAVS